MKLNILFVEDELKQITAEVRKLMYSHSDWRPHITENGPQALTYLAGNVHVDIIVSDMRMPDMDGITLLNKVKEKYPNIIRIIISDYSDKEKIIRSAVVAHQILSKPYDSVVLAQKIERIFAIRSYLANEKLLNVTTGIGILPSLPALYISLDNELRSENFSLKRVAEIISTDISVTAKLLQLVNSAFFGLAKKITSIEQAVTFLGVNIIRSFVLYINIFSTIKIPQDYLFFLEDLWNHSLKVAQIAKEIYVKNAKSSNFNDADDAYIAGILHDIGQLVLLRAVPNYAEKVLNIMVTKKITYYEAEYELLGTSHAEVGGYLLGLWDLPYSIVEAVTYHHMPSKAPDKSFSVLTAVHLANALEKFMPFVDIQHIRNLNFESQLVDFVSNFTPHVNK
ncbi:MAG: hypothetical protein HW421_3164 [Ignavibacteria bacterium]|nr:hypothetical protein [Ignavibacteria bacterium]